MSRKKYKNSKHVCGGISLSEIYSRAKSAIFEGARKGPSPSFRRFMEVNKNKKIVQLTVCRVPILGVIDKALNIISLGGWQKNKEKYKYDDMFHLYIYIRIDGSGLYRMDKNHVVEVEKARDIDSKGKCMQVYLPKSLTVAEFIKNGEEEQPENFWNYNPETNNCQVFVMSLLIGNNLLNEQLSEFVKQCAKCVLNGYTSKLSQVLTDIASRADVILHGKSFY